MHNRRRHVFFSGRVQGVGFRYTVQRISGRYDVTGFVRNLADGRVELVAEGTDVTLDAFIQEILTTMDRNVSEHKVDTLAASDGFSTFEIRY